MESVNQAYLDFNFSGFLQSFLFDEGNLCFVCKVIKVIESNVGFDEQGKSRTRTIFFISLKTSSSFKGRTVVIFASLYKD